MRYELHEKIGEGSSATVHRATDRNTLRTVVVKVLKDAKRIPKRELDISQAITSQYVCKVLDYYQDKAGQQCIVLERVDGFTLREYLEQKAPLNESEAVRIGVDIAKGLADMHAAGYVHRDLSTGNVLVTAKGSPKITDLGFACPIGTRTDLTKDGQVGTRPYAAPEQFKDGCVVDERSDVYAFGVLLCEMASGKPFVDGNVDASIRPGLPSNVKAVIRQCTDMDPARRFTSIADMLKVLEPRLPALRLPHWYRQGAVAAAVILLALLSVAARYLRVEVAKPILTTRVTAAGANTTAIDNSPIRKKPSGRVAILDFTNQTGDQAFDRSMIGVSAMIESELSSLHGITLVDAVSAAAVVSGSVGRENGRLVLTALVEDALSHQAIAKPRVVAGPNEDLFQLQGEAAREIAAAIQKNLSDGERQELQASTSAVHSREAFRSYSDGLYFLRQDMASEALKSFDQAVALDAAFPQIQYYRAQALEKLNRVDEAIQALKASLPGADTDHPLLWHWELPRPGPRHGLINALDAAHQQKQHSLFQDEMYTDFRRQVLYADVLDNSTALYFVDPVRRVVKRQEVQDAHVQFLGLNDRAYSDGNTTIITAVGHRADGSSYARLYAFSSDGSRLWNWDMPDEAADDPPLAALIGDSFFVSMPIIHRVDVLDTRTGHVRWSDNNMSIDGIEFPLSAHTRKNGDIVMFRDQNAYRAVRLSDGKEAWRVAGIQSGPVSQLVTDQLLVLFEPDRRILLVDLESGKPTHDIALPPFTDDYKIWKVSLPIAGAYIHDDILYVLSKEIQLCAINLKTGAILWKTPLPKRFYSIGAYAGDVYLTTEDELIVLDARGTIVRRNPVPKTAMIHHFQDHVVVLTLNFPEATLFALSDSGKKLWEYPRIGYETIHWKNLVTSYASEGEIYAVDPPTGDILWKFSGNPPANVQIAGDRIFVLHRDGVSEYSTGKRKESVADRQIFTALARLSLQQHNLEQATAFAAKAADLDPDYPPLARVRSQILQAQNKHEQAGMELARYARLIGVDSKDGQQAIAEMIRNYRLQWEAVIDTDVAGDPQLVDGRLVGVGRRVLPNLHVEALNEKTGEMAWRYPAERFVASMVGTYQNKSVLWYVSGEEQDARRLHLSRIDIRSGDITPVATWSRPLRIEQAWITYAGGRLFVASAAADTGARIVDVGIDAVDIATGSVTPQKNLKISNASTAQLSQPVTLFAGQKDTLTYAIGSQRATIAVPTNAPTNTAATSVVVAAEPVRRLPNNAFAALVDPKTKKVIARHPILWRPYTFAIQSGHLYAFTADGHAYAMNP